VRIETERVVFD